MRRHSAVRDRRKQTAEEMEPVRELLREGFALRLDEAACLPLRSRHGQCRACESACPKRVLKVSIDAVELSEGCIECGRCAAACPNDALALPGFDLADGAAMRDGRPLEIECDRVPAERLSPGAQRVPCLGGLSSGAILALGECAGARGLALIDRGGCGDCEAGCGARHPADAALSAARLWLESVGCPDEELPRLEPRALPAGALLSLAPSREEAESPMSRRQFFRAAVDKPAGRDRPAPAPMGSSGRAAFPASGRRPSRERARQIGALDAAARRHGTVIPAEFYPRVHATGACVDHRICAAICPTGALKVDEAQGGVTLTFAGEACIGCSGCVRACPEGALGFESNGGERVRVEIARHQQAACVECGDIFTPREQGDELCMSCRKSRRFVRDAMEKLYGAGR